MYTELEVTFLTSGTGIDLIREAESLAASGTDTLRAITRLRKQSSAMEASHAWEIADLRRRAASKIGTDAAKMYFDRDGYEMASSHDCAEYHARILANAGVSHVLDLCAGIGADSCRFAQAGIRVTAYECDPGRAHMARANAAALGVAHLVDVVTADVTTASFPNGVTAAFFDPARRDGARKRIVAPDDLMPPLTFLSAAAAQGIVSVLAKLSPAVDRGLGASIGASTEFLSADGECKEALLRTGAFRTDAELAAVLLPDALRVDGPETYPVTESRIGDYIYEPDPAVIRAGLVGRVADAVDGWLLDADIAYVMGELPVATPLGVRYKVLESFPFHIKTLQKALNNRDIGKVVVKKRGFPLEPEEVRKQLKLKGQSEAVIVLTKENKRLWAMIVERYD